MSFPNSRRAWIGVFFFCRDIVIDSLGLSHSRILYIQLKIRYKNNDWMSASTFTQNKNFEANIYIVCNFMLCIL